MSKKKVTKADLDKTLRELGFKEGDEIILPSKKSTSNESEQDNEDDTGGGNPPTDKGKPDKP